MARKYYIDEENGLIIPSGWKIGYDSQDYSVHWGKLVKISKDYSDYTIKFASKKYFNEEDQIGVGYKKIITFPAMAARISNIKQIEKLTNMLIKKYPKKYGHLKN